MFYTLKMHIRIIGITPPDSKETPCLITPFTVIHFLSGAVANVILRKLNYTYINAFILWFFIHMIYELKDLYGSYVKKSNDYYHNHSLINSITDQTFALFGFIYGDKIPIEIAIPFIVMYTSIVLLAYGIKAS